MLNPEKEEKTQGNPRVLSVLDKAISDLEEIRILLHDQKIALPENNFEIRTHRGTDNHGMDILIDDQGTRYVRSVTLPEADQKKGFQGLFIMLGPAGKVCDACGGTGRKP